MKLDDFLADMNDTGKVLVEAKQLRKYAKLHNEWWSMAVQQGATIKKLTDKICKLEAELNVMKFKEPITVDLFI